MVVKERRGRRRYIAFKLVSPDKVSAESLLAALISSFSSRGIKAPKLIQFDGRGGIVRVPLDNKNRGVEALNHIRIENGFPFSIETLRTSGTIRTLRERYFGGERD